MFDVEPMVKTRVLCASHDLDAVVDALYDFGAIHVTRSKAFSAGRPSPKLEGVSHMLVKIRGVESSLALNDSNYAQAMHSASKPISTLRSEFDSLDFPQLDALLSRKQAVEAALSEAFSSKRELEDFKTLDVDLHQLSSKTGLVDFIAFEITGQPEKALAKARESGSAVLFTGSRRTGIFAAWDRRKTEKAKAAMAQFGKEMALPQVQGSFAHGYSAAVEKISSLSGELSTVKKSAAAFASKHGHRTVSLRRDLEAEFKKAELPSRFGQNSVASAAEGWVSKSRFHSFESSLSSKLGERIVIEKVETGEMPPTKLKNFFALRPFEFMIQFFSLPRYGEIDPTFFTALTYPLFFGMILGDMGYGLVILLLGIFLTSKAKAGFLKSLGGMMVLSAVSTIIFGFIFAEFFGLESIFGLHFTPILSRIEEEGIESLLGLTVLIGAIHMALGFSLGIWQAFREGHRKHGYAKISWLLVEIGLLAFVSNSLQNAFTQFLHPLGAVFASPLDLVVFFAGVAGLAWSEGIIQLFEIPSVLANVLSYLRIMALGLSGVALAGIINTIPVDPSALASFNPVAWIFFALAAVMLVLGHAMVLGLGILEAGIQSLRLHYVEFYSKFYKGGGIAFTPLRDNE